MDKSYTFIENPVEEPQTREAYFALARSVFGLDFEPWHASGYWGDRFIPYTLFDDDIAVSCVGAVLHDFRWKDRLRRYVQLSTVMTAPSYRGRGLNRFLMEKVLDKWRGACDAVYLHANDSVRDYYPKFGFKQATEYQYSRPAAYRNSPVRKLDINNPADVGLLVRAYAASNPFSALTVENNASLLMFHCLTDYADCLYYAEAHDAVIIAERDGENLFCLDIYAPPGSRLDDIIGAAASPAVKTVSFGFTPKAAGGCAVTPSHEQNSTLFILKGGENLFAQNRLTLPYLSRA